MILLWEILVPTVMAGRPIRTRYHRVWDGKVRAISGGLTILHPAKGHWVSPGGELFVERMIPVRIACTEEEIERIADMTAKYYKQEAVMYYVVSARLVIRLYDKEGRRAKPREDPEDPRSDRGVLETPS
jgi:hypothetical protein